MIARPPRVFIRALKPWRRLRLTTLGWKVLFMTSLDPRAQKGAGIYIFSREKVNNFMFSGHFRYSVDKKFIPRKLWIKIPSRSRMFWKQGYFFRKLWFLSEFFINICFLRRFNIVVGVEPVLGKTRG